MKKIDWMSISAQTALFLFICWLGTLAAPNILPQLGFPITPVSKGLLGIVTAFLLVVVIPKLFSFISAKYKIEDKFRVFFRNHTDLRRNLTISSMLIIVVSAIVGLLFSILIGQLWITLWIGVLILLLFLQVFLIFTLFPKLLVGVEGSNDILFLKGIAQILRDYGENIPDLTQLEENGDIIFIPVGGNNLKLWLTRLRVFNRPEFYIFDRDTEPPIPPKYQSDIDQFNERPHCKAVATSKREMENYLHPAAIQAIRPRVEITFGDFDDVPCIVAKALHNASDNPKKWEELTEDKQQKKIKQVKGWLNSEAVLKMTPQLLDQRDQNGDVRGWLLWIAQFLDD